MNDLYEELRKLTEGVNCWGRIMAALLVCIQILLLCLILQK